MKKYSVTGDWSQSITNIVFLVNKTEFLPSVSSPFKFSRSKLIYPHSMPLLMQASKLITLITDNKSLYWLNIQVLSLDIYQICTE